jgi:cell division protein FtsL
VTTKNISRVFMALSFAGLLFVENAEAYAQDAAAQTKAEIDRLQQSLKAQPTQSPDLADLLKELSSGSRTPTPRALPASCI